MIITISTAVLMPNGPVPEHAVESLMFISYGCQSLADKICTFGTDAGSLDLMCWRGVL